MMSHIASKGLPSIIALLHFEDFSKHVTCSAMYYNLVIIYLNCTSTFLRSFIYYLYAQFMF